MTDSERSDSELKVGQVGNLIIWGTTPIQCPVCHETVPAGETHRHDGPLDVDAEWHDPETGRIAELWIEAPDVGWIQRQVTSADREAWGRVLYESVRGHESDVMDVDLERLTPWERLDPRFKEVWMRAAHDCIVLR